MEKTIYDVAGEAGVSISTVSRVINNSGYVSERTREKVLKAMEGYYPSAAAREMNTKKTYTLGITVRQEPSQFFVNSIYGQMLVGISDVAKKNNYNLLLDISNTDGESINLIRNKKIDGLILTGVRENRAAIQTMLSEGFPFVLIGSYRQTSDAICQVDIDDFEVGRRVTEHLLQLGHRKIGMLTGNDSYVSCVNRLRGYESALRDAGVEPNPAHVRIYEQENDVYQNAVALLSAPERVSAVFAYNDRIAVCVYRAAAELGLSIPGDVSVVGVDDIELAKYISPPLTTVWQPSYDKGAEAARLLIEMLQHPEMPRRSVLMRGELVPRDSCAPPSDAPETSPPVQGNTL